MCLNMDTRNASFYIFALNFYKEWHCESISINFDAFNNRKKFLNIWAADQN